MRRFLSSFVIASLLLTGLCACSEMRVNTDYLISYYGWSQIQPKGQFQGVIPRWTFMENGTLLIHEGGFLAGSCIPDCYAYTVRGKMLELLPSDFSSVHYDWDKPFTFKILQCTQTDLSLKLLSIPTGITTAGLSATTDIIELQQMLEQ